MSPLLVVGIVSVVAVMGIGLGLAIGGGGDGDGESTEDAVRAYFEAFRRGDCEELAAMAAAATFEITARGDWISDCRLVVSTFQTDSLRVGDVETTSEDGNSATVSVAMSLAGETSNVVVDVVNEDGTWKVIDEGWDDWAVVDD